MNLTDGSLCSDPDGYWFWDYAHPSTRAHRLIASLFALNLVLSGELRIADLQPVHSR